MAEAPGPAGRLASSGRPVRVLVIAPSLDILGGQAIQAARLMAHLSQDPSLHIEFLPINPRLPGALRTLQRIKYVRTLVTSLLYGATLLARAPHFDVLHIFSASYFSFLLAPTPAIWAAKLFGKKTILNYRSGEAEDHLRRWRRTALPVMRRVDVIAVPSGYLVDVFRSFGLAARPIFNTVDTSRFRFRPRHPLRPVFLSNRNLEPLYNVACVVRAFALIQAGCPEARLTVAGDGSQRNGLENLASELRLRNASFIGRVAPERMPGLYDSADIYLNSPNIDNMPASILEAFACGLPVVSTNAGGIPYIVTDGKTGLLVDPGDHQAMARCALRLLEDEGFASQVAAQAQNECLRYGWAAVKQQWLKLYEELACAS